MYMSSTTCHRQIRGHTVTQMSSVIGTHGRWPTGTDYATALQNPSSAFTKPRLRAASAAKNTMGVPLVASGQNAVVFLLRTDQGDQAVRCFTTPPSDGAQRYDALGQHLSTKTSSAMTVSNWLHDGICVDGKSFPIVVMPWVEGQPLSLAVEDAVGDPDQLRRMAHEWVRVVVELQAIDVTHGDLQHGNVLVSADGRFSLVDLDGSWVPSMQVGAPNESGHPNYQHPLRSASQWGRFGDSFSALVIEVGLRALAADASLERYLSGENLLFERADLLDPRRPVWHDVGASTDLEVVRLSTLLARRALDAPERSMVAYADLRSGSSSAPTPSVRPPVAAPMPVQPSPASTEAALTWPAMWYPDPSGSADIRYWDGQRWTDHVAVRSAKRL